VFTVRADLFANTILAIHSVHYIEPELEVSCD